MSNDPKFTSVDVTKLRLKAKELNDCQSGNTMALKCKIAQERLNEICAMIKFLKSECIDISVDNEGYLVAKVKEDVDDSVSFEFYSNEKIFDLNCDKSQNRSLKTITEEKKSKMRTKDMIKCLRNVDKLYVGGTLDTSEIRLHTIFRDTADRLEELADKLDNINRLLSRDIFDTEYTEHKKRGNSCNGAQLQMMEKRTLKWIHTIGYEKTKEMLINDFDKYFYTSLSEIGNQEKED